MKKFIAALLALTMVLSIAACGSSTSTPSAPAASTPAVSEAHSEEDTPSEPEVVVNNEVVEYYMSKANEVVVNEDSVTFTDDSGREPITIKKNPEKVAVLYGSQMVYNFVFGTMYSVALMEQGGQAMTSFWRE